MNRRQKIIVSVTGIFLVLLILVGLTYAYFLTQIQGNEEEKSITVTTANLIVEYGDGNNTLEPENAIVPDTVVGTKTFTVTNKGNDTSNYVVVIEDVVVTNATTGAPTTFETNDFVYTLTCNKYNRTEYENNPNTAVSTGTCNGISTETEFPMTGGLVVRDEINVGEVYLYGLTLTYKDNGNDQSNDMNKTLSAKVNIRNEESFITVVTTFKKGTSINLTTSEAIEDSEIESKAISYPFTIENTGETHQNITIKLSDIKIDDALKDVDFRWGLFNPETGRAVSRGIFADIGDSKELTLYTDYLIESGEEAKNYELKIWLHNDGSGNASLLNKSFKANISVFGKTTEYTPDSCFVIDDVTDEFAQPTPTMKGLIRSYDVDVCGTDVVIPKTINGITVKDIYYDVFKNKGLTSIIIPEQISAINRNLLSGNKLTSITLHKNIILGQDSLSGNPITDIYAEDGALKWAFTGEGYALSGLNNLKSIVMYGPITNEMVVETFSNTTNLKYIVLDNTTKVPDLSGTAIESLEIPATVTEISSGVFNNCTNLKEIIVRDKTSLEEFTGGYAGLTTEGGLPDGVTITYQDSPTN